LKFSKARHQKLCSFTDEQWRWLQDISVERRASMVEIISQCVDFAKSHWLAPSAEKWDLSEDEILNEHRENLEVVNDDSVEMQLRYDKIFVPYINTLTISDEIKQRLLHNGMKMTQDFIRRNDNDR